MYKIVILSKIKSQSSTVDFFKEVPFYNKPIEKAKVERLKNIDRLAELPFYEQKNKKDPVVQLEASKSSIKDFF